MLAELCNILRTRCNTYGLDIFQLATFIYCLNLYLFKKAITNI